MPRDDGPRPRIVLLHERADDADAVRETLETSLQRPDVHVAVDERSFRVALADLRPDLVVLDHAGAWSRSGEPLEIARERSPDTPVIVLSPRLGEDEAVEAMRRGAADVVFHDRPSELPPAVERALSRSDERRARRGEDRRRNDDRRRLLDRLVVAQEEERRRIVADIHDDAIQVMTAAGMRLETLGERLDGHPELAGHVRKAELSVREAIARLRALLIALRPPSLDTEGLGRAIVVHLGRVADRAGIRYGVDDGFDEQPPLAVRETLYRIVQEAVDNVLRHARASELRIVLEREDGAYVARVIDDGAGFDPDVESSAAGRLGLVAMRERAESVGGRLTIESAPGAGSVVEARIPPRPRHDAPPR